MAIAFYLVGGVKKARVQFVRYLPTVQ